MLLLCLSFFKEADMLSAIPSSHTIRAKMEIEILASGSWDISET